MTKGERSFLRKMRGQHWYALVSATLADLGIEDWEVVPPRGRGHPKLIARHNGRELRLPVPSTEGPRSQHKYLAASIRQWARDRLAVQRSGQAR